MSSQHLGVETRHIFYVCLWFPSLKTLSKMCFFKIGQYHLTLLNSPPKEVDEWLFEGLLVQLGLFSPERTLGNPFLMLFYGPVYQDLYFPHFEDQFGCTETVRKLMMSSMSCDAIRATKMRLKCVVTLLCKLDHQSGFRRIKSP